MVSMVPVAPPAAGGAHPYRPTLHSCYLGFVTQAIVNNLAPLLFVLFRNSFGLSYEQVGRLVLLNFGTQIAADLIAMRYADRVGYRFGVVLAHGFCAAGLVALGVFPFLFSAPYPGLAIAVILYAIGGGFIEVLMSPIVDALPGEEKASAMSLLHSFYCWGQAAVILLSTVAIRLAGEQLWFVLPVLWAILPLYNLLRFRKVPMPSLPDGKTTTPLRRLSRSGLFRTAVLLMLCAGASELTMTQWSSLFAEQGLGIPKIVGDLLGPGLLAVFMGIVRTWYGLRGAGVDLRRLLWVSGFACVACYALAIFARSPVAALAGCAACGFTVALMWPGTLSLSAARFPAGGTALFGALAVAGDLGGSAGPWIAGLVSDLASRPGPLATLANVLFSDAGSGALRIGLLAASVFPVVFFVGMFSLRIKKNRPTDLKDS